MTPKFFVLLLCSDMNQPASAHEQIVEQMHEHNGSHHRHATQTQAAAAAAGYAGVDEYEVMGMMDSSANNGRLSDNMAMMHDGAHGRRHPFTPHASTDKSQSIR